jgi:multidrug efflux pump subunit AcrB
VALPWFINWNCREVMALDEAIIEAAAVRLRPTLLTAAAVVEVIVFEPFFRASPSP